MEEHPLRTTLAPEAPEGGISRRSLLRRLGTGAAVAWSAPVLTSMATPAYAVSPIPRPECVGATCGNFIQCSSTEPDCVCATTDQGAGFCVPGSTPCEGLSTCPEGGCPPGFVCLVDTCCVRAVCVPITLQDQCPPDDGGFATMAVRQSTGPGTIGG